MRVIRESDERQPERWRSDREREIDRDTQRERERERGGVERERSRGRIASNLPREFIRGIYILLLL